MLVMWPWNTDREVALQWPEFIFFFTPYSLTAIQSITYPGLQSPFKDPNPSRHPQGGNKSFIAFWAASPLPNNVLTPLSSCFSCTKLSLFSNSKINPQCPKRRIQRSHQWFLRPFQESLGCLLVVRRCPDGDRGLSRPCWKTGMEVNNRKPWEVFTDHFLYMASLKFLLMDS